MEKSVSGEAAQDRGHFFYTALGCTPTQVHVPCRPQTGSTGFDPRLSAIWPGAHPAN
jgi:hypothetical protein